ncbi:MAG: ABC transporter ATP-binding protein [Candidatus Aminicenantes bacterium]|nr:ABC transporter ATP-binding protein [Candidatus Aminicenantes bacterium]
MEKKKILELQGVTAGYNGQIVLEEVNLSVYEKDFIGVIGANGSGKTTLLKVILGLLSPIRGKIRFFIEDARHIKKHIGYIPQASMFDKKFPITVESVAISGLTASVGLFHRFSRRHRARAHEAMEQMGILHLKNRAVGELSGGQMQRVFLARALISSPKLLVLDEPNTFVDKSFEKDLYEILKELNKEIAIILVSHDLGMISSYVKTIACVCRYLHYHESGEITQEVLESYSCPIDLIAHGDTPHRVLKDHQNCRGCTGKLKTGGEKYPC